LDEIPRIGFREAKLNPALEHGRESHDDLASGSLDADRAQRDVSLNRFLVWNTHINPES